MPVSVWWGALNNVSVQTRAGISSAVSMACGRLSEDPTWVVVCDLNRIVSYAKGASVVLTLHTMVGVQDFVVSFCVFIADRFDFWCSRGRSGTARCTMHIFAGATK